jgi:transposase-like protein
LWSASVLCEYRGKDLLGDTLEEMLQAEMTEHLGYGEYERTDSENARNGKKTRPSGASTAKSR